MQRWRSQRRGASIWMRAAGVTFACVGLLAIVLANAQHGAALGTNGPPPFHARHGHRLTLPGSLPRALGHARLLGPEDGARHLHLSISLALSNANALEALIASQHEPKSSQYQKYLTPQTFAQQFGPPAASVTAVRQFLELSGLQVTSVSANRALVDAEGSIAQVEQAFKITIGQFQIDNRTVYAPEQDPVLPDTLAPIVLNVGGLDNVGQIRSLRRHPSSTPHVTNPNPGGGYTPTNLRNAYDVSTLIGSGGDGTGQHVAVFEQAAYITGDITTYRTQYGLPSAPINNFSVDNAPVACAAAGSSCDTADTGEADMDVQVVSALAPNATQDVYAGPTADQGIPAFNDVWNAIVSPPPGGLFPSPDPVVTTSYGLCEPSASQNELATLDNFFAQAASQGQTIFAAAGDTGSDDCFNRGTNTPSGLPPSVDAPASDPYVLGVGGTSLSLSSAGSYGSETTWNQMPGFPLAGGGGVSSYFSQPSWQAGADVNGNLPYPGLRQVPDVAADADPRTGYSLYCSSIPACNNRGWTQTGTGGTSASAPLWAGIVADLNRYLVTNSKSPVGWANRTLYQLFANAQTYAPFHDVTSGNNDIDYSGTPYAGNYPAAACYDLTTGMGTPDAWNIARDIQNGVQTAGGGACTPTTPSATELVQDGGFEPAGASAWQQFAAGGSPVLVAFHPHTGQQVFWPCGYPACDDRVWQTITVPTAVHSARLRFWLREATSWLSVSPTPPCLDHFYVTLATRDGTVFDTVESRCEASTGSPSNYVNGGSYYTFITDDVTSALQTHAGQSITLMFRGTTGGIAGVSGIFSAWLVDDVSLAVT